MEFAVKAPATLRSLIVAVGVAAIAACASSGSGSMQSVAPNRDPRVGLRAGLMDAEEASWNLRVVSKTPPSEKFKGITNSDLSFSGIYAIQGNYNGFQVWDISNPAQPTLKIGYLCPASQSDVSVFKNLLFVSGEGMGGRLDCAAGGVHDSVSAERLRGIRIFDITDIANPRYIANVQTCRGSHTHTVVIDPNDADNVYVYVSGSAGVRSPNELAGCVKLAPAQDSNSALFRIEVIKVPLAHPESGRDRELAAHFQRPHRAASTRRDAGGHRGRRQVAAEARAHGGFTAKFNGQEFVLGPGFTTPMLDSIVKSHQRTGPPTGADSAALRAGLQAWWMRGRCTASGHVEWRSPRPAPSATTSRCIRRSGSPAARAAGTACCSTFATSPTRERIAAVADSNFSFWHSATFNNDGTEAAVLRRVGRRRRGRSAARPTRHEWGADAIFTLVNDKLQFQSYYKMPAPQTQFENCVAHNGSLIPIPGRDIMVQAWYQGGISVFDWTRSGAPEGDRASSTAVRSIRTAWPSGGSWSAYWYNGVIVSSEIAARPRHLRADAERVHLAERDRRGEDWCTSTISTPRTSRRSSGRRASSLARAYLDQLERTNGLAADRVAAARTALASAEGLSGQGRKDALMQLSTQLTGDAATAADQARVTKVGHCRHGPGEPVLIVEWGVPPCLG